MADIRTRRCWVWEITMRRRLLFSLVAILLAIGGGVALRLGRFAADAVPAPSAAVSPAIPVTAGVSATADVPVYLTGLGAVQALNTVTVKVRVDGQLDKVNFTEGEDAKSRAGVGQVG